MQGTPAERQTEWGDRSREASLDSILPELMYALVKHAWCMLGHLLGMAGLWPVPCLFKVTLSWDLPSAFLCFRWNCAKGTPTVMLTQSCRRQQITTARNIPPGNYRSPSDLSIEREGLFPLQPSFHGSQGFVLTLSSLWFQLTCKVVCCPGSAPRESNVAFPPLFSVFIL